MRLLLALLALIAATAARAETLVVSLSTHRVAINSTYSGTQLAIFGAIERDRRTIARATPYDLVVTVRGPRGTIVVREKRQLGPIWINRAQRRFQRVPTFMLTATSRPMQEFVAPELATKLGIGFFPVISPQNPTGAPADPADIVFRASLVRLKFEEGLYQEFERGVTFLTPSIFQAPIRVPASAPTGNYTVDISLFADGVVLAQQQTNFEVVKAGFEQFVAESARETPLRYGLAACALAIMFGWLASVAFRRD